MPARCPDEESRRRNTLHVFSSPDAALRGMPSYNPTCLKWQAFLKLAGIEFGTAAANNHASPTGVLPFLLPAAPAPAVSTTRGLNVIEGGAKPIPLHHRTVAPVTVGKLEAFVLGYEGAQIRVRDVSDVLRAEVYQSLLDTSVRSAWLYSLYLSPDNTELLCSLYVNPTTSSSIARASTLHSLRRAAEAEIIRSTNTATIDAKTIYRAADDAIEALSMVLGEDTWFFEHEQGTGVKKNRGRKTVSLSRTGVDIESESHVEKGREAEEAEAEDRGWEIHSLPSLFDAAVFAYTHLLLDKEMKWRDRRLADKIAQAPSLQRHRDRVLRRCWLDSKV